MSERVYIEKKEEGDSQISDLPKGYLGLSSEKDFLRRGSPLSQQQ